MLLTAVLTGLLMPAAVAADEKKQKVVRVGWFESEFCYYDRFGRRHGVDYEYHQRIAAYTGWTYEYVEDSWPNLFEKLKTGEIDLLSDVSYKQEREKDMYFSELPMGSESYYIYVGSDNREISADNISSFNGKRIGVNSGSYQETLLREWSERHGINIQIVPLTGSESDSKNKIARKEIDGYASIYISEYDQNIVPTCRIGGSDYYYAVSKKRPDLLEELNMAMADIQEIDPYFNEKLSKARLFNSKTNVSLTPKLENWISKHGEIRIGYRENYLPFCATDKNTGELTGALKDFLAHIGNNLNSPNLKFKTIPYESTEDAIKALNAGEIDCIFPVCMSTYDAQQRNIMLTDAAMETEMNAIMRASDRTALSSDSKIKFAVNQNMVNIESFIMDYYPESERIPYKGLQACYDAVSKGEADCVLVSNYRMPSEEETLSKNKLVTIPTGESLNFSFAMRATDLELFAIMNKAVLLTGSTEMDTALASYMYVDQKVSYVRFVKDNWFVVLTVLTLLFGVIIFQLVGRLKMAKQAGEQQLVLEEAKSAARLQQTVSALLDNMPGLYYTKDAETGEYLACNQALAEYFHKKDPSEVIGHKITDFIDKDKAKRSIEDDKMALSMDEPLIFYDKLEDASGTLKNVKITKQKYTDSNGRLCLMGIHIDASENLKIFRESMSTKEDYEKARSNVVIFTYIAQALAQGYMYLFYVDVNTEEFIEYGLNAEDGSLAETRRGWHFFEESQDLAEKYVYPDDRENVIKALERKTLVNALNDNDAFVMTFRMLKDNEPQYVSLKVTRLQDDENFIILSLADVDEQMKHQQAAQRIQEERISYGRISALSGEYMCIYVVVPETGRYRVYSSTAGFDSFAMPETGDNFFSDFRENSIKKVYAEDQNRVFIALTMENALAEVEKNGIFTLSFRLVTEGEPRYVKLKAAIVDEKEGRRLVVGVNDIDAQVRQEEDYGRRLAQARIEANIDALTGVKNRNAYRVYEERLNAQIEMDRAPEFAIVILDVNDLKKVNDNEGHKAGDQFLRDACKIVCTTFKRSPVFRVGGDEFAVLAQGDDYDRLDDLIDQMNEHNEDATANGGIVIALGMSRYDHDEKVASVYERADQTMYENKKILKEKKKQRG